MPEWARGKTADEVLMLTKQLVEAGLGQPPVPQSVGPPQPMYNTPAAPAPQATVADDDYLTGKDVRHLIQQAVEQAARQIAPQMQTSTDLASSAALGVVRTIHKKDFDRYGPEIAAKLQTVPRHLWTLDNLETVVKLVRSDHIPELAREEAQQLVSQMEPTIRSSGGGSTPVPQTTIGQSLDSEKISPEWKARAQKAGITEETVKEFCAGGEMTVEEFYKQFDTPRTMIVSEIGKLGES